MYPVSLKHPKDKLLLCLPVLSDYTPEDVHRKASDGELLWHWGARGSVGCFLLGWACRLG